MVSLSIILPVYNGEEYIATTLRHILNCQLATLAVGSWEIIIVDDGSTDCTAEILDKFRNQDIHIIRQVNSGAAVARNVGLKAASGRYVYFMDSDDLLTTDAISLLIKVAESNEADIVKFCMKLISHEEYLQLAAKVPQTEASPDDFKCYSVIDFLNLTQGMTTPSTDCTVLSLYRREFLTNNVLEFNESLTIGEDVDLAWQSMFCKPKIMYAPVQLYLYHQRADSISHNPKRLKSIIDGQEKYLYRIIEIREQLIDIAPEATGAVVGINNTIRFYTNLVQANKILVEASYREIFQTMVNIRHHGGDIHPGRPRFNGHITLPITRKAKCRRWVSAYILALIVKLCYSPS